MAKFLDKQDYDLFFELMRQREIMQKAIDECVDNYKASEEGRMILESIRRENQVIMQRLQMYLNRAKQQQKVSKAYDGVTVARPVGARLDRGV
ncbi:hypothetical protein SDC9_85459 [bioreactor metagenome]|uniref:Flagellar protein FliT n=1 Tax=bioreactor metagenome TaxID=1076179 RepID=A0A644ZDK0_9ZZZZ